MTIAEKIAEEFGNDGLNWTNEHGRDLDTVCVAIANREWRDGYRMGDVYRYRFADGSAIVIFGDAWDVEGADPFTWAGA